MLQMSAPVAQEGKWQVLLLILSFTDLLYLRTADPRGRDKVSLVRALIATRPTNPCPPQHTEPAYCPEEGPCRVYQAVRCECPLPGRR